MQLVVDVTSGGNMRCSTLLRKNSKNARSRAEISQLCPVVYSVKSQLTTSGDYPRLVSALQIVIAVSNVSHFGFEQLCYGSLHRCLHQADAARDLITLKYSSGLYLKIWVENVNTKDTIVDAHR